MFPSNSIDENTKMSGKVGSNLLIHNNIMINEQASLYEYQTPMAQTKYFIIPCLNHC